MKAQADPFQKARRSRRKEALILSGKLEPPYVGSYKARQVLVLVCFFLWLFPFFALAHDPGLSSLTLQFKPDRVEATLALARTDAGRVVSLEPRAQGSVTNEPLVPGPAGIEELAGQSLEIRFDDQPVEAKDVKCEFDGSDVLLRMTFNYGACSNLFVRSKWLTRLPGHRQFISVRAYDRVLAEQLLSANADSLLVPVDAHIGPTTDSFGGFLVMGMEHIWTGYDHLLFLFGLLIVARSFGSSVKIITCFTIAHSITLAVATLSRVQIPSRIVEPLIAASIVYVGVENLLRNDPKGRGWLTFAFGLVHGFGFASVLRELGVAERPGGVGMPLFAFNLGVELGQVAVAAVILPFLWKLRTRPGFAARWVPAASVIIVVLGSYWFVQRIW